jgi:hypothetical protein
MREMLGEISPRLSPPGEGGRSTDSNNFPNKESPGISMQYPGFPNPRSCELTELPPHVSTGSPSSTIGWPKVSI